MLETRAMKAHRRILVTVVAALLMVAMFFLLPVFNRTEPMTEVPKIRFDEPSVTILSPPPVPPLEKIEPEEITTEVDKPKLEAQPDLMEIVFDQPETPLETGDGVLVSDAAGLFVPLVAFDTIDLDENPGAFRGSAPKQPFGKKHSDTGPWAQIHFVVETDGSVSDARIEAASDGDFGEVGLEAVRNWRFTDSMRGKKSVRTWVVRPFPLRDDQ